MRPVLTIMALIAFCSSLAWADVTLPGSNHGTDGVFAPVASVEIDLGKAQAGAGITWESPGGDVDSDGFGDGVYDPDKWAVVFKYSSVNIPAGVIVTFKNHPTGAPVVWLVQGNVVIDGHVNLDGGPSPLDGSPGAAGPGGFPGGWAEIPGGSPNASPGSSGRGPGGGRWRDSSVVGGGVYATRGTEPGGFIYGNDRVIPLIGGSGGAGTGSHSSSTHGGTGGGGAILIACENSITIAGSPAITARSSGSGACTSGPGSGGAIRLVSDTITGQGTLYAYGAAVGGACYNFHGGNGRIRLEYNTGLFTGVTSPACTEAVLSGPIEVWPGALEPSVRVTHVNSIVVPADPRLGFSMKVKEGPLQPLHHYREQRLETEVVCGKCTLRYSIFGVFAYCPDCGTHNSRQILEKNLELSIKQLDLATQVDADLARHLTEDALENVVSAFDGFGRELVRVHASKATDEEKAKRISFQNLNGADASLTAYFGIALKGSVNTQEWEAAVRGFQRRHLLAHKMGVVDQKYLDSTADASTMVGRRIVVSDGDVRELITIVRVLADQLVEEIQS